MNFTIFLLWKSATCNCLNLDVWNVRKNKLREKKQILKEYKIIYFDKDYVSNLSLSNFI